MTLRKRIDRIEAGRGGPGLPDRLVLFTSFVDVPPEGEAPGPGSTAFALVVSMQGGPGATLWREEGEAEADFRARAEATADATP